MVHIERHKDPNVEKMEQNIADIMTQYGADTTTGLTGRCKSSLPSDNRQVTPEEAMAELRAMNASTGPAVRQ